MVWCCERLRLGYIETVDRKTAGAIASEFVEGAANVGPGRVADRLMAAAADFRRLVVVRNDIMHAQPCHAPTGEERLQDEASFGRSRNWSPLQTSSRSAVSN